MAQAAARQHVPAALLQPFWETETIHRESLFFLRQGPDEPASAPLLFRPTAIHELTSATGETVYREGVDFRVEAPSRRLLLTRDSRITWTAREALYAPSVMSPGGDAGARHGGTEEPRNAIDHLRGDPGVQLLFGEGRFFHDLQCCVTYAHAEPWDGTPPAAAGSALTRTMDLLAAGDPLRLCLSGDSIAAGGNASAFTDAPPHLPAFGQLLRHGLRQRYGSAVTFSNLAVGGKGAAHGVEVAAAAGATRPDLMIIAYGMNDVGRGDPAAFVADIAAAMEIIRRAWAATEFILVAPMLGNPEWVHTPTEAFWPYRDALASLCGQGVVLADMTRMWSELLGRKRYHDLTGNGVNHPNDFGHRVYAQVLLRLLCR